MSFLQSRNPYFWFEKMYDAIFHALESDCPKEEYDKDDVGVDGRNVDHFRILRNSLDDA